MGEEVFRTLAARAGRTEEFIVDSAGLIDFHKGELPDPRMRKHAMARGYHLTHHSRPVSPEDFHTFDFIVAMDEKNLRNLTRMAHSTRTRAKLIRMADYLTHHRATYIPDPYYGTDNDFEHVIDLLEDACTSLLNQL